MAEHELRSRSRESDEAEILENWHAQVRGMDEGDAEMIAAQFAPGARLVRANGRDQPLAEWLASVTVRDVVYGRLVEREAQLTLDGDTAHLVARLDTGVDPDDVCHGLRLRSELDYAHSAEGWLCTGALVEVAGRD